MRIAVDLDSTLNTLIDQWLDHYNRHCDDNAVPEDITEWGIHNCVKHGKAIYNYFDVTGAFYKVGIQKDAFDVMNWLYGKHDVYIVSALARPRHYEEKLSWIKEHLPFFNTHRFIACHAKEVILTEVMLDDGLHNLDNFEGMYGVVYDQPWNRSSNHYTRVHCWLEFKRYIREIAPID